MSVAAEVTALTTLSTEELHAKWEELFNKKPTSFIRSYLISRLAYRIQEMAYGGLPPETKQRLDDRSNGIKRAKDKRILQLTPGTVFMREYQGEEHRVVVLDDGFEYKRCKYKSLSKVAQIITGTKWSGPVFFGLRAAAGGEELA